MVNTMNSIQQLEEQFGPIINTPSRAELIDAGQLYECPAGLCKEVGFKVPVALSKACYEKCVEWDKDKVLESIFPFQEEEARLFDVLYMAMNNIRSGNYKDPLIFYKIECVPPDTKFYQTTEVDLVSAIGPGDNKEPVITIYLMTEND